MNNKVWFFHHIFIRSIKNAFHKLKYDIFTILFNIIDLQVNFSHNPLLGILNYFQPLIQLVHNYK